MHLATPALRPATADDLNALVETTRSLLAVAGAAPGVYVLEERPDGSVAVTDGARYTNELLDILAALLALLSPGLSFAGMGWAEEDDWDSDPCAGAPDRPFLREIDHAQPTAHAQLAARVALEDRVAAANPQALFLWNMVLSG
jgi:hypothetical protein